MADLQVRMATTRAGTPCRFQSERKGECDTKSQIRRSLRSNRRSILDSAVEIGPPELSLNRLHSHTRMDAGCRPFDGPAIKTEVTSAPPGPAERWAGVNQPPSLRIRSKVASQKVCSP